MVFRDWEAAMRMWKFLDGEGTIYSSLHGNGYEINGQDHGKYRVSGTE
jgi:hypothetical protein